MTFARYGHLKDLSGKRWIIDFRPQRPWSYYGRAILILLLIPLLAASRDLRNSMPPADLRANFDGRRPFVYWNDSPDVITLHFGNPHEANDEPINLMNVDTGEVTRATRAELVCGA